MTAIERITTEEVHKYPCSTVQISTTPIGLIQVIQYLISTSQQKCLDSILSM